MVTYRDNNKTTLPAQMQYAFFSYKQCRVLIWKLEKTSKKKYFLQKEKKLFMLFPVTH